MEFLAPGLAWFALAGAIPIVIHLLNRQKYKRVRWAAMEFLLAALHKTRRRLQLENLLLLAIRVLILVLLALGIARPYLTSTFLPLAQKNTHLFLLVDTSYSMGYKQAQKTPLARAKEIGLSLLHALKNAEGDRITIIPFHEHPATAFDAGAFYADQARQFLDEEVQLTDFGTRLPRAVDYARDLVAKSTLPVRRVYVLSDLQRVAWQVEESERERFAQALTALGQAADVTFVHCGATDPSNRTLSLLAPRSRVVLARRRATFEVRVHNHGPNPVPGLGVTLKVDKANPQIERVSLEPRSAQDVQFACEFAEPGPHLVTAEVDPDFLAVDDTRALAVQALESIPVLIVDGEPGGNPFEGESDFLRLALDPAPEDATRPSVFSVAVETTATFDERKLGKYAVVALANVDTLSEEKVKALEAFVRAGGGLFIACGDLMDRLTYNDLLYKNGKGLLPARLVEAAGDKTHAPENARKWVEIDYHHPALEFFRDRLQAALGSLVLFQYMKVETSPDDSAVRVLARMDDPDLSPALIERRFGRGKVLLCTTSADAEWNLMPGRPPYVVLMNELGKHLGERPGGSVNVTVGEPFQMLLRMEQYAKAFQLATPRQEYIQLYPGQVREDYFMLSHPGTIEDKGPPAGDRGEAPEVAPGAPAPGPVVARELGLTEVGAYELRRPEGGPEGDRLVAYATANVRPDEGDLEPVTEEEIKQRFPGFKFHLEATPSDAPGGPAGAPPRSLLWTHFLWAALALLAAESVLAWRFGSRH